MLRLGVNTWLWANRFEERHLYCIDNAARMGAEVMDFSVNDPYSFPVDAVAEKMAGTGMEAVVTTALPTHCNPISPEAWERKAAADYMRRLIDIAAKLKAPLVGGVTYAGSGYHSGKIRTQEAAPSKCLRIMRAIKSTGFHRAKDDQSQ